MKIYYHPVSTTSRMIKLFAEEEGVDLEFQVVDLFTGEHLKEAYDAINPNHLVPVLEDGDFRLTESSAILKYLADKIDSPAYPKDLRQRARVNERMDWINTQLCTATSPTGSSTRRSSRRTSGRAPKCSRRRSPGARSGPKAG